MKNLKIYTHATIDQKELTEKLKGTIRVCVDSLNETLYFATQNSILIVDKKDNGLNTVCEVCFDSDEILKKLRDGHDKLVLFDYLSDDLQLCLVLSSGRVITIEVESQKINYLDLIENGFIIGGAWSPDSQLLVLTTNDMVYLVSRDFEVISKDKLRPMKAGRDELMTVGWGSRETQFQGSAGRKNREQPDQNRVPVDVNKEFDNHRAIVSWRADAQFFTISSVDEVTHTPESPIWCRQLRVWSRDLELMSKCEFLAGMEPNLCMRMRPNGNLMASTRVLNGQRNVWFFERNGQYRSNFKIPYTGPEISNSTVSRMEWNIDSTVLALYFSDYTERSHQLQFWTVSNYSWMEKLRFDVDEPLLAFFWDPECPHRVHFLTGAGHYHQLGLSLEYNCENMLALSINGANVRITDLKYAPIPPPMCHFEIPLGVGVPSAFALNSRFGLAVISADFKRIAIHNLGANRRFSYQKTLTLVDPSENTSLLYDVAWKETNALTAVRTRTIDGKRRFEVVLIKLNETVGERIIPLATSHKAIRWHSIFPHKLERKFWCFGSDSSPSRLECQQKAISEGSEECVVMIVGENSQRVRFQFVEELESLFFLNDKHQLFVNGCLLSSSVVSFSVVDTKFLVFTTIDALMLHCVPLGKLMSLVASYNSDLSDPSKGPSLFEKIFFGAGRTIESGSQLIGHEPDGTRVWLQMPRGNLEVIHPRAILIDKLKGLLDALNYKKAFIEMRRHRIDTNLLYDHNPQAFSANIHLFVDQIDDVDLLNQFLTTLQAEDSTQRMFAPFYPERNDQALSLSMKERFYREKEKLDFSGFVDNSSTKINVICAQLRQHIIGIMDVKRLHRLYPVILTSYVTERPRRIAAALSDMQIQLQSIKVRYVKVETPPPDEEDDGDEFLLSGDNEADLKAIRDHEPEVKVSADDRERKTAAQKWLRHLSYLVNGRNLFNHALKTYDLEIALLVAEISGMNPKEYEPLLADLQHRSPPAYQRFHIDLLLEEWSSALRHIAQIVTEGEEFAQNPGKGNTREREAEMKKEEEEVTALKEEITTETQTNPEDILTTNKISKYLEECQDHIAKHDLYSQALYLFQGKKHYKDICLLCADFECKNRSFREAAILYRKAGNLSRALECLASDLDYRAYLRLAKSTQQSTELIHTTLKKMAVRFEAKDRFADLAEVLKILDAEKNAEKIVDCLGKVGDWTGMIEFADEYQDTDLGHNLKQLGEKALKVRCDFLLERIQEWHVTMHKQVTRLEYLRRVKSAQLQQIVEQREAGDDLDLQSEAISEASTTVSTSSRSSRTSHFSTASGRKRKQIERKKRQIKEGSQFEDAALLVALKALYEIVDAQQDEMKSLLSALLSMDMVTQGRDLQSAMLKFLSAARHFHQKIWPSFIEPMHLTGPIFEIYRSEDGTVRLPALTSETMPSKLALDDELFAPKLRHIETDWMVRAFVDNSAESAAPLDFTERAILRNDPSFGQWLNNEEGFKK